MAHNKKKHKILSKICKLCKRPYKNNIIGFKCLECECEWIGDGSLIEQRKRGCARACGSHKIISCVILE